MACGNQEDHCCYFGDPCEFLEKNTMPDRIWACGLRRQYGSWDAVYESPEFSIVLANAIRMGLPNTYKCHEWPLVGYKCETCGEVNNG